MNQNNDEEWALCDGETVLSAAENGLLFPKVAFTLWKKGLSVIPLYGAASGEKSNSKGPHHGLLALTEGLSTWEIYQKIKPPEGVMEEWRDASEGINYGVVCGASSMVDIEVEDEKSVKMYGFVYIIDIDEKEGFECFVSELMNANVDVTSVRSGRGGHIYFLSTHPLAKDEFFWCGYKIEIKGQGCYATGPGSIHHTGAIYTINSQGKRLPLVDQIPIENFPPLKFAEKKSLFSRNEKLLLMRCYKDIYDEALYECDGDHHRVDLSPIQLALASIAHNRKYQKETFVWALKNVPESHYKRVKQDIGEIEAERTLNRDWERSHRLDSTAYKAHTSQCKRVWEIIFSSSCSGSNGILDRLVLRAHIEKSLAMGKMEYFFPQREGSSRVGCTYETFMASTKRLKGSGFLSGLPRHKETDCSKYRLNMQLIEELSAQGFVIRSHTESLDSLSWEDGVSVETSSSSQVKWQFHGDQIQMSYDEVMDNEPPLTLDVFEHRGVGRLGRTIHEMLSYSAPKTNGEIANITQRNPGVISVKVKELLNYEMLQEEPKGKYKALPLESKDYVRINHALRTSGKKCGVNGIKRMRKQTEERKRRTDFQREYSKNKRLEKQRQTSGM